ncbi:nucleotidyltransferase family protein [Limisalsivibrio acetivorans]|uniref:nucleotidyltransferase family protein n=1 Tax=Limisalsivibrio acetivorans TaxID=1304888 RepID=UPI0003B3AB69|nr:nucleotidyltransferase family protein [Limisalsivibrio acetivorans]
MKPSCLIMAAGLSRRMGREKLLLPLEDSTILGYMLRSLPLDEFERAIAVVSSKDVADIFENMGIEVIFNRAPEKGKSETIRLGTKALEGASGIMFLVADQPLISPETVSALCREYTENPNSIVIPVYCGNEGNPVIFPPECYEPLQNLSDDSGGRVVIEDNRGIVRKVDCGDNCQSLDTDTEEDYRKLLEIMGKLNP